MLEVNLTAPFLLAREIGAGMVARGQGKIVFTASLLSFQGGITVPGYAASKHGVLGLTKTAALEYATRGIRVNAVCPGVIHTEMIDRVTGKKAEAEEQFIAYEPMGRMGTPEEVGEAAAWLCSDAASFVTGLPMAVDGGLIAQ